MDDLGVSIFLETSIWKYRCQVAMAQESRACRPVWEKYGEPMNDGGKCPGVSVCFLMFYTFP